MTLAIDQLSIRAAIELAGAQTRSQRKRPELGNRVELSSREQLAS